MLRVAPLDVGELLAEQLWPHRTAVLTSATLPAAPARPVGLPPGGFDELDVGSPFDYATRPPLLRRPPPRPPPAGFDAAVHDELEALIAAAGGRTLALFTSYRAMQAAVEALRPRLDVAGPRPGRPAQAGAGRALRRRARDLPVRHDGLLAGRRRARPLALARHHRPAARSPGPTSRSCRPAASRPGPSAFATIDLPRAATLLAQGAGRLIRTATDRGVVAVLDPRLANASYRWAIVNALPPMRRTRDRAEAEAFLQELTG